MNIGHIVRVAGSVVDVAFEEGLPRLREALRVQVDGETRVMEVARHIEGDAVRCIMLAGSEGLRRGMEVRRVALSALCPVKKALAFLERGRWLELLLFDGEGRFVGALSQAQFCAIAERADIYRPIADYLAVGDTVFAKNGKENETFCQKVKISPLQNEEVYGKIKDAMYILRER